MISYFLSRWRLSRLFEPCEGGYLYRRKPTAEAVLVSAEERVEIFRRFRSTYWKSHAILWLSFIVGVFLLIGLVVVIDAPPEAGSIIGYAVVIPLIAAVIYVNRRVFNEAASAIADRPAAKPARRWSEMRDEQIGKAAWWKLIAGGFFLGVLAWLTFSITKSSVWAMVAWICYFGLCFALWGRNIWRKLQIERLH